MNIMAEKAATEVIKRSAMHIAAAMIHGNYPERDRAYSAARDIQDEFGDFIQLVKRSITMLGGNPDKVWVVPAEVLPAEDPKLAVNIPSLRYRLARHIAGAYVSGSDDQVARAKELETELDGVGLNVDNQVDQMVLEAMRTPPSRRGVGGQADDCPF